MTWREKRSRWDSNPHILSDAGFRDRCNTNYATAPSVVNQVGAPGFEPGTSASRTQRSTGLSHAPNSTLTGQTRFCGNAWARTCVKRTVSSGWGGIRTHEGINPHDFQSCALSRSATHPVVGGGKGGARTESHHHHFTTSNGGSGIRTHADLRPTP